MSLPKPKPKPSYSRHPELPSLAEKETEEETIDNNQDWLIAAKESIQRDLEASKKELELVRDLLVELDDGVDVQKLDRKARDRLFSLRACQEYCGSRSCMLEERLRQIDLWSDDARMGRSIPHSMPDEWATVDMEWRQWLSEQVVSRDRASGQRDAVESWGPLIPILAAYID